MIAEKSISPSKTLFALAAAMVLVGAAFAGTYTVINTDDSGEGSLRWAMTMANQDAALDSVVFDIPGDGPHTIQPTSLLPQFDQPVVIDGYTQSGSAAATAASPAVLKIVLDGSLGPDLRCFHVNADQAELVVNQLLEESLRRDRILQNLIHLQLRQVLGQFRFDHGAGFLKYRLHLLFDLFQRF